MALKGLVNSSPFSFHAGMIDLNKLPGKKKRERKIQVHAKWDYTDAPSPAFRRLMHVLLHPGKKGEANEDR